MPTIVLLAFSRIQHPLFTKDWFADVNRTGIFPVSFHGEIVFKHPSIQAVTMCEPILDGANPATILGGGELMPGDLDEALRLAPRLVAADGGAAAALRAGLIPESVVGDMDSLPADVRAAIPADRIHWFHDQDSTDFDKAMRVVRAPFVLGAGFLGGRVDHTLANFSVLMRRPTPPCVLIGPEDVLFAAPPDRDLEIELPAGARLSLYPLTAVRGRSSGLHWPIDGIDFGPMSAIGTSNRVADGWAGAVRLRFDAAGMLVIMPRGALPAAVRALVPPHALSGVPAR